MFSPQRKSAFMASGGRIKPAITATESFSVPPPPLGSLTETASLTAESDDWQGFKDAGLLDQSSMAIKDHQALADNLFNLQSQLFDYQYNMGLLLIEKEDWTSKYEELRQALSETHEILKREKTANLIALSEAENREVNLRSVLGTEKQCVAELEKALREMNTERAKIKHASDSTVAEANKLLIGTTEKSLELEKKFQAAEAKLAEAYRKCANLDVKLEEVEARENLLQKEQRTLRAEREAFKERFGRQSEDLREWERKLHEREDNLCKSQRALVEREEKANDNEKNFPQMEIKLHELQKQIDSSKMVLSQKKEDVNKQLEVLTLKEKEAESLRMSLEKKGIELQLLEEKLSAREKIEVKQLLDEHRAVLDLKMREFDLELEEKRNSNEKELSCKADELKKKEAEINHKEEIYAKRENAMHERSERLKVKNKETDDMLKAVKEREKAVKVEERKLEAEKKQLVDDKESLQSILVHIEEIKAENTQLEQKISDERESLRVNEKERSDHVHLQSELKQEIEKYRHQNELLLNKATELKHEKENFEKQWGDLDEKKSRISVESKKLADEKENLENLRQLEEDRLKEEKRSVEEFILRELENLEVEKGSFADKMKSERLALDEKAKLEQSQMVQDLESQRRNLETEMQSQKEKMDKLHLERRRVFEEERERELKNIEELKETSHKEMEEVRTERLRVEKKREELAMNKEKHKKDHLEMQNDIDNLVSLNKMVKNQREGLTWERAHFLALVDKLKSCNDSEEMSKEMIASGFDAPLPSIDEEILERTSDLGSLKPGGRLSWLQKCASKILKISPGKSEHEHTPTALELPPLIVTQPKTEEKLNEPVDLLRNCTSSGTKAQTVQSEEAQKVEQDHSNLESKYEEVPEDSMQSKSKTRRGRPTRRNTSSALHRMRSVCNTVKEAEASFGDDSVQPSESNDANESLGDKKGKASKTSSALHRTRSVRDTVREAEAFLGDDSALLSESNDVNESVGDDKGKSVKKRHRSQASRVSESENEGGDSEACSGSVTTRSRRRTRQRTADERYNLRSSGAAIAVKSEAEPEKKTKDKESKGKITVDATTNSEAVSASSLGVAKKSSGTKQLVHVTNSKTVEFSENKVVRFITPEKDKSEQINAEKVEITELSAEDESGSSIRESEDYDSDEDEDDVKPGETSVGKKIWTFLTT